MLARGHIAELGQILAEENDTIVLFIHYRIHIKGIFIWENDDQIFMILDVVEKKFGTFKSILLQPLFLKVLFH